MFKGFIHDYMRILFLVFALITLKPFIAFPQETKLGIKPEKPLNSLSMDQWTGRDGLISNNLTSVSQSSSNFLWVTSFNGFLRFDGVNFKLYDKNALPFLNSNAFYESFEDSKGNLWFTSQSSGIIKYDGINFSQVLSNNNSLSARCISEDANGTIWIGTNNEGVYCLQDSSLVKVNVNKLGNSIVMDIVIDDQGKIWFATNGNGIVILDGEKVSQITHDDGLKHNTVNALFKDSEGKIYIGTQAGVNVFDREKISGIDLFDGLEINAMLIDEYLNLWAGSEQGLYKLHLPSKIFDSYTEENGLPSSQISSLCFDHENSLWISTKKAGLIRFMDGFFENITVKDHLSSNNVNIITEHQGAYYIGCDDGQINIYKDNSIRKLKLTNSNYNIGVRDISFGKDDEMLVASYRGLLQLKGDKEKLIDLNKYGASNDIRRILRAQDGAVWLATRSSGVIKYIDENHVEIYNSGNSLKTDYILALEENKNGDIYIGTHSGGLSVIKKNGKVINYMLEGGKSGVLIFNMEIIDNDAVWIATNIGIYKFDNEVFKKVSLDQNLKAETIFDIVIQNGNAWLSSNIGLIKVEMSHLEDFISNDIDEVPGRMFDRYDGMASQECTGATRMTLSSDGKLFIPTLGGVSILNPDFLEKNQNIPKVYITDFITDFNQQEINNQNQISIDPDVIRYEFYFTSLSYLAPPKVRFRYKLVGIDEYWVDAGIEREAVYTNLPKGNYTFSVIASNNDGIWNDKGANLKFTIKPHFYETIVFYVLVIICLGLIVWGIIVWRIHNIERVNTELRKVNEELDRFVYSASHDLRAPLSSVMGLVEIARLEKTLVAKDQCLSMINDSIHKLDGFINDIIDYSRNQRIEVRPDKVDFEFEVNEVFHELQFMDRDGHIKKYFKCDQIREFITDGRRVGIILKNLISNSIRYHDFQKENQYIDVEVSFLSNTVILKISDNGIGIDEEHLQNIFKMFYRADEGSKGSGLGLYIVKETVDKLKGKIEVTSEVKKGTTFTIELPELKIPD